MGKYEAGNKIKIIGTHTCTTKKYNYNTLKRKLYTMYKEKLSKYCSFTCKVVTRGLATHRV